MSKFLRYVFVSACAASVITAYAQPFTFNIGGKVNAPTSNTATSSTTLSPDDFKAKVNEINQQNLNRYKEERNHDIANAPPLTVQTNAPTDETTGTKSATSLPGTQTKQTPATTNTADNPTPTEQPATTPAQSNIYTGYQGAPTGSSTAPAKPSGGWGVKY